MSRLPTGQQLERALVARVRRYRHRVIESFILFAALSVPAVRCVSSGAARRLPLRYKVPLGALFVLQLVGQLLLGERGFPFVRWELYGQTSVGEPEFYEYWAVLQNGSYRPLVLAQLMPGLAAKRLASTLFRQVNELRRSDARNADSALRRHHEQLVCMLAKIYERKFPQAPLLGITVRSRVVFVVDQPGRVGPLQELWSVRITA
jgi:hypothetical protein